MYQGRQQGSRRLSKAEGRQHLQLPLESGK